MLVYYFTTAEFTISNLKNRHLKVSEFTNLNDPFELLGIEMTEKDIRHTMSFEKNKISKTKGLICFSASKYDPVQWAHYGEQHKGACFGFEIPDSNLKKVDYVALRLSKSILNDPTKEEKLLTTKFKHWSYEQERRLIIELEGKERINGLIFEPFSPSLVLKEIYIGCKSSLRCEDIQRVYSSDANENVVIKYTRPAFKDFKIVWDQSKKSAHA